MDQFIARHEQNGYTEAIPNIMALLFPKSRYAAYPMVSVGVCIYMFICVCVCICILVYLYMCGCICVFVYVLISG